MGRKSSKLWKLFNKVVFDSSLQKEVTNYESYKDANKFFEKNPQKHAKLTGCTAVISYEEFKTFKLQLKCTLNVPKAHESDQDLKCNAIFHVSFTVFL